MKVFIHSLVALLLLGAIFGGIFGYKFLLQPSGQQMGGEEQPVNVMATEVREEQWRGERRTVGSLTAVDRVAVSTEAAGIIESIAFRSGQGVEAGEVLLELDKRVDEAELAGLEAEAALARIEFERAEDLLPRRAISQSQLDEARARLDSAVAAVETQRERIAQKTIRAPFTGALGLRRVSPGQFLAQGSEIVELRRLDPIYADFSLPERFLPELSEGQEIDIRISAYDEVFRGEISAIDSGVSEQTRSVSVRATLDNADGELRPGMFARVNVLEPESRDVLTIPNTAVSFNTYGDFAIRINESDDGLVSESVQIETGEVRDGRVEVLSGLEAGDRIVATGLINVRPGQPVEIEEDASMDPSEVSGQ